MNVQYFLSVIKKYRGFVFIGSEKRDLLVPPQKGSESGTMS